MENNRYNNSKIYKLVDQVNGYYYIGSTCNPLSKRLHWHKQNSKKQSLQNIKVYKHFNSIGWENVKIILIQEHYLDNKEQLLREEDNIIQMYLYDAKCLNSYRAFLSEEERKEHKMQYRNQYNNLNKEKINEQHKQYYEDNKERVREKQKEYIETHKQQIRERNSEKITCLCGSVLNHANKATHNKTRKHQAWLQDQQQTAETI